MDNADDFADDNADDDLDSTVSDIDRLSASPSLVSLPTTNSALHCSVHCGTLSNEPKQ